MDTAISVHSGGIDLISGFRSLPAADRRMLVLRLVADAGGTVAPAWQVGDPYGYAYWPGLDIETREVMDEELLALTAGDYLKKEFFDRLHRCPSCDGYVLNLRETCGSCHSTNLRSLQILHHFRCGYVAPATAFDGGSGDRTCPKCSRPLKYLGTDHEVVGDTRQCLKCGASEEDPVVEAVCLSCGARTAADQLVVDTLFTFSLTNVGLAALRANRLFERDNERLEEPGLPVFRRSVFLRLMTDELHRMERYKTPISLLIVKLGYAGSGRREALEKAAAQAAREFLRTVDQIGRLRDDVFLVGLPATPPETMPVVVPRLRAAMQKIEGVTVKIAPAVVKDISSLERDLEEQAQRL